MLEHVRSGGRPYDVRGNHITEVVSEMAVLSRFNRAQHHRVYEGVTQELVESPASFNLGTGTDQKNTPRDSSSLELGETCRESKFNGFLTTFSSQIVTFCCFQRKITATNTKGTKNQKKSEAEETKSEKEKSTHPIPC